MLDANLRFSTCFTLDLHVVQIAPVEFGWLCI